MLHVPAMGEAHIHKQGEGDEQNSDIQERGAVVGKEGDTEKDAQRYARLPGQKECALGSAALTVLTQLDEKQEKPRTYQC